MGFPFRAFYVATKFALEGYSESLRLEVKPFGVHVSLIEPGAVKTPANSVPNAARSISDYYSTTKISGDKVYPVWCELVVRQIAIGQLL